jgi:hydrogenase maturation protein HypF
MTARRVHITGVVQGVGFRPFVWQLARQLDLRGWVRNSSAGVDIHLEGASPVLDRFVPALRAGLPPLARIDDLVEQETEPEGRDDFAIVASRAEPGAYLPVSPDVATCDDCLRELNDPADRRHGYPFLNCTNCGPRYTIVRDIPYDRPATTLAGFPLCADCAAEYGDPADRRFHAQPVACPACGPHVWLEREGERVAERADAIADVRAALAGGEIVAVKGLGGFHLACDAASEEAVAALRARKRREGKPFALMARDLETAARCVDLDDAAAALLTSPGRPVVLAPASADAPVAPSVAPGRDRLGVMLPYTPLHHLLLAPGDGAPAVLVMTSANHSDEPIAYRNDDARTRLADLADLFMLHDRPIHVRCDDSVATTFRGAPYLLRRSRGHAPLPVDLPVEAPPLVATGGELKNVFALARDRRVFLGHHIGELGYHETLEAFVEGVAHVGRLFRVEPEVVAHDLHPDYQATRWAQAHAAAHGLRLVGVQHHHAHLAACLADTGQPADARAIGLILDGTGYGHDGTIWGGEVLVGGYADSERAVHLRPSPLPGGDAAARHPWRVALAWLRELDEPWDPALPAVAAASEAERDLLAGQLTSGVNTPTTTSMGRLFDAAAALAGLAPSVRYEAQAACEFESAADARERGAYRWAIAGGELDPRPALAALVADVRAGTPLGAIAARFHRGLADILVAACTRLRAAGGPATVALSGGVWQNLLLLELATAALEASDFTVLVHRQVPANDGGLALGQAAAAAARLQNERT